MEFKQYLQQLCEDLSGLLFEGETDRTITVEAAKIDIPTVFAIPLAFIVNELITNSAKYARSNITVRLRQRRPSVIRYRYRMTGRDCRRGFDPAQGKGLGMKIIATLVKQIGGALQIAPGEEGHGTRFIVKFRPPFVAGRSCHGA